MKTKAIGYWVATGLAASAVLLSGIMDLAPPPELKQGMTVHLGYPLYFLTILGAWKVLGAIAIAVPKFPRLKEWAYAGIAFDFTGAAISHASVSDPASKILTPLVLLGVVIASWALRPKSRALGWSDHSSEEKPALTGQHATA